MLARWFAFSGIRSKGAVETGHVAPESLDLPELRPSSPAIVEPFRVSPATLTNNRAWCACCVQYGGSCASFVDVVGGDPIFQCTCPAGDDEDVVLDDKTCPVSARRRPPGTGPGLVRKL